MTGESRRLTLRMLTRDDHERLDHLIGPLDSLTGYRRYLSGISAFRVAAERAVGAAEWPAFLRGWQPAEVSPQMAADLADLGERMAPCPVMPVPGGPAGLAGLLYVLEGSALGARVLVRRAGVLGLSGTFGARHLAAQIAAPGTWRTFTERLDEPAEFDVDSAGQAAREAFRLAFIAMSGAGHEAG
ncbi:biliverdin-producing heme oxygenase [Acetobacter oeni]|nr:biliverdin-producing heme oxygenase [Acetobacter oeni]MBB3882554.1 heme oxygenase [Acetobacter oeni]NHO18635.1 heme oxygenase [Acetobacter oeni]GBR11937.1 heme oxygenase [Acetobacter oeni LMG 21952]